MPPSRGHHGSGVRRGQQLRLTCPLLVLCTMDELFLMELQAALTPSDSRVELVLSENDPTRISTPPYPELNPSDLQATVQVLSEMLSRIETLTSLVMESFKNAATGVTILEACSAHPREWDITFVDEKEKEEEETDGLEDTNRLADALYSCRDTLTSLRLRHNAMAYNEFLLIPSRTWSGRSVAWRQQATAARGTTWWV